jgi:arginine/ornithine transport system substrate-binding protein
LLALRNQRLRAAAFIPGRSMKKLILALAIGALTFTAMAQDKELKVAIDPTYEPFTFKTPDRKPTGFDVDIANAVCAQIKRKCVFVEQLRDGMIPGLQARKYTIISSMSITEDRLKVVDFADKSYNTPSKIVVKNSIKFADPASLKGKKIAVLKGSTQEKYANGELVGPELYIPKYFGSGAGFALRQGETALKAAASASTGYSNSAAPAPHWISTLSAPTC